MKSPPLEEFRDGHSLPPFFSHVGDQSQWQKLHEAFEELVVLRCYVSSERDTSVGRFWASVALIVVQFSIQVSQPEMKFPFAVRAGRRRSEDCISGNHLS